MFDINQSPDWLELKISYPEKTHRKSENMADTSIVTKNKNYAAAQQSIAPIRHEQKTISASSQLITASKIKSACCLLAAQELIA